MLLISLKNNMNYANITSSAFGRRRRRRPGGEIARAMAKADKTASGFGTADFYRQAKTYCRRGIAR